LGSSFFEDKIETIIHIIILANIVQEKPLTKCSVRHNATYCSTPPKIKNSRVEKIKSLIFGPIVKANLNEIKVGSIKSSPTKILKILNTKEAIKAVFMLSQLTAAGNRTFPAIIVTKLANILLSIMLYVPFLLIIMKNRHQ